MNRWHNAHSSKARELALSAATWVLIASPAAALWAQPARGWLAPYLLWLSLIAAAWTLARLRQKKTDPDKYT